MGCRQHCASPPRAESLTCRSSSHLLLWFESNGSHRHRRVTLFLLAESRLRRFQRNQSLCLRSAAGEKRGFRPLGEPSTSHLIASLDAALLSAFDVTTFARGDNAYRHSRGEHSPFGYLTPSVAQPGAGPHTAPSASHVIASLSSPSLRRARSATSGPRGFHSRGEASTSYLTTSFSAERRNQSHCVRFAADEERGSRPLGEPTTSHFPTSFRAPSGRRLERDHAPGLRVATGNPSTSYTTAPIDVPLGNALGITTPGARSGSRDCRPLGKPCPFTHLTPSSAQAGTEPYIAPSPALDCVSPVSHSIAWLDVSLENAISVTALGAAGATRDLVRPATAVTFRSRGEHSPSARYTSSPMRDSGWPYTVLAPSRSSHVTRSRESERDHQRRCTQRYRAHRARPYDPPTPRYNPITT